MVITLYYFDEFPGRSETARLLLSLGGVDFVDKRISLHTEWRDSWKSKMPFHQVPVLEVDGKMLAQMAAIDRFCAGLTGRLPEGGAFKVAEAEQVYHFIHDIWMPLEPPLLMQFKGATEQEQDKAWEAVLAPDSLFRERMALLDNLLANRKGKFITGDKLTHVDLWAFSLMSQFQSGWLPCMPKDILSDYPAIKAFRNMVASLPEVKAYYSKQSDEIRQTGFTPDKTPNPTTAAGAPVKDAGSKEQQEQEVTEATKRLDLYPEGKTTAA